MNGTQLADQGVLFRSNMGNPFQGSAHCATALDDGDWSYFDPEWGIPHPSPLDGDEW